MGTQRRDLQYGPERETPHQLPSPGPRLVSRPTDTHGGVPVHTGGPSTHGGSQFTRRVPLHTGGPRSHWGSRHTRGSQHTWGDPAHMGVPDVHWRSKSTLRVPAHTGVPTHKGGPSTRLHPPCLDPGSEGPECNGGSRSKRHEEGCRYFISVLKDEVSPDPQR